MENKVVATVRNIYLLSGFMIITDNWRAMGSFKR